MNKKVLCSILLLASIGNCFGFDFLEEEKKRYKEVSEVLEQKSIDYMIKEAEIINTLDFFKAEGDGVKDFLNTFDSWLNRIISSRLAPAGFKHESQLIAKNKHTVPFSSHIRACNNNILNKVTIEVLDKQLGILEKLKDVLKLSDEREYKKKLLKGKKKTQEKRTPSEMEMIKKQLDVLSKKNKNEFQAFGQMFDEKVYKKALALEDSDLTSGKKLLPKIAFFIDGRVESIHMITKFFADGKDAFTSQNFNLIAEKTIEKLYESRRKIHEDIIDIFSLIETQNYLKKVDDGLGEIALEIDLASIGKKLSRTLFLKKVEKDIKNEFKARINKASEKILKKIDSIQKLTQNEGQEQKRKRKKDFEAWKKRREAVMLEASKEEKLEELDSKIKSLEQEISVEVDKLEMEKTIHEMEESLSEMKKIKIYAKGKDIRRIKALKKMTNVANERLKEAVDNMRVISLEIRLKQLKEEPVK